MFHGPSRSYFAVLANAATLAAEPLVVDLWPGEVPGDVGISGQENSRTYESPLIGGPTG
jgi:hypothetical protein